MSDDCAFEEPVEPKLRARRIATEKARAGGWKPADLAETKIDPNIIPMDKDGKPCPEQDGFLVSSTALQDPAVDDSCKPSRYADAMVIPAAVLPRGECIKIVGGVCKKRKPTEFDDSNAKVGDLAVIVTPDLQRTVFAVIGDTGPSKELGEGSIALNMKLLGKQTEPQNYDVAKTWGVPKAITLIFSGTRDENKPYTNLDRINKDASKEFADWGGTERLKACMTQYRQ